MRVWLPFLAVLGTLSAGSSSLGAYGDQIIPETTATRHGLTRAWFAQIQMDLARARVAHVLLHKGSVFVETDQAVLHALDAETGQTLWAVQVGRRGHPSLAPAANDQFVAVVNGSYLYVLRRHDGKQLWQTQIDGAPGAGPALSEQRAYVPTLGGLVLSYSLTPKKDRQEESKVTDERESPESEETTGAEQGQSIRIKQEYVPPLTCFSAGRALVQPIVTRENEGEEFVAWPTDRGFLFVGSINRLEQDRFVARYRLETTAGIAARPTYLPPDPEIVGDSGIIYAASRDGYVHAIREKDGQALWRFSTGEPLLEPAVVVNRRVYAATQPGGMYCLDAKTGSQLWWTPQVLQFVAASNDRVYAIDRLGRLLILDIKTGARLDAMPLPTRCVRELNDQTDRIYLASETGVIQCLHEIELAEPIQHRVEPPPEEPEQPAQPKTEQEGFELLQKQQEERKKTPPEAPFGRGVEEPFGGGAAKPGQPFGGGNKNAFGQDNPFK